MTRVLRRTRAIGKRSLGVTVAILLISCAVTQAQAPSVLLKDAQAELQAAAKALNESDVFQRYQRAKRLVDGLTALAKDEKADTK